MMTLLLLIISYYISKGFNMIITIIITYRHQNPKDLKAHWRPTHYLSALIS